MSLAVSVVAGTVGAYVISFWPLPYKNPRRSEPLVERGIPGIPSDPKELSGRYIKGYFTGADYLTLLSNGTYSAKWEVDVGNLGEAAGNWSLQGTQLVLSPSKETDTVRGLLRVLDVYRFKSNWIFVSMRDREDYEKHGITPVGSLFHFEKVGTR